MVKTVESKNKVRGRYGVVVSRFNEFITKKLLTACLARLKRSGVKENEITIVWVPGSFELPLTALKLARKKNVDAVICLGAVIRGETIHFDLVCRAAADGIGQASLLSGKPVVFGVLSTNTVKQAYARSQEKGDNKGKDAALAAIEMVNLLRQI